ncbi:MAG TPA: peroxidase family protein [Thermoleophilaceae bacterium]|nr:peroxidase family protein [Thermoleophilaceae bacterium]
MSRSLSSRGLRAIFSRLNKKRQWHEMPTTPLKALNLLSLRLDLRDMNLFDTGTPIRKHGLEEPPKEALTARRPDGKWNDLNDPEMGSTGSAFTRNIDPKRIKPEKPPRLHQPSARKVSLDLMTRHEFQPATTLNVLAAAWIQFENHNWFFHGRGEADQVMDVPLEDGDDWPENPMHVRRTVSVPAHHSRSSSNSNGNDIDYGNTETHWWDASQLYGSSKDEQDAVRTFQDGKLKIGENGRLLPDPDDEGIDLAGFNENWWFGLSCLHTLFTKEHNAICDVLKKENPRWDDQRLFDTAWLINSALMAKIHTVEWTPGIVNTPALWFAMNINWSGIFGQHLKDRFGRLGDSEIFSGIMGSPQEHHDARFQLTEEFVSVYRMHPLVRDDWNLYESETGQLVDQREFVELQGASTRSFMDGFDVKDLIYSMGIEHPGKITLHNYPRALQRFKRIDGELMDLATLDILRDRERGVPRYNDFREQMRMPRVRSFDELTPNRQWAEEIRRVYNNDIDNVDLQVGMYAEPLPPGFGFSDTAFRVFILMASRRLKSDRFFTTDFRPEVYTQTGIDWVTKTKMKDVILRHYPELSPALEGLPNAFLPWHKLDAPHTRDGKVGAARKRVDGMKKALEAINA